MNIEQSGNISDLRVIQSSGDEKFDASAIEAVRRAAPFQPVPLALKHLIGDLVIVLDPTPAAERGSAAREETAQALGSSCTSQTLAKKSPWL
jgi:TonB family protein